ncbi:ATP-binding cassette domain-containing protein [Halorubrum sp. Atlit-26R]|uniref:ATP-binding cassette domain-containing protein n=1 Tax=Halorubrum sp. Atlit-26R TaxID=2282128 RepID=UPI000EF1D006|nr:ATP-binding cassette domain-containing protein [Halorubrum sp. Atlit-26R]RLM67142.1 ATP-binding cassette domain-containing protein [Halorubrum sp. Atlit-26R]
MDAIQVDTLTKRFETTTAVDGLSFTVEQGELFGMLGPNGAGKSTLINILCTLLKPSDGRATVNGYDIREETAAVRDSIGIVFQEPALDEELTGAENLAFHARLYGLGKAERTERIDEVLELVDLATVRDEPVKQYSGGMKRRLEIARGLIHEPAVLFLDEPTLGLDAQTRRATWEYIRRMNEDAGVTVVLTTHYMEEADQLCDRVAIVDQGKIVALDTPEALKDQQGGDVIVVGLDGDAATLVAQLETQSWVREIDVTETEVHVTLELGETRIPDLVRIADDVGVAITSVELRKPSLETVFLSLTGSTLREAAEQTTAPEDGTPSDDRATSGPVEAEQ